MFTLEIISFNPSDPDAFIDVDVDFTEVKAINMKAAKQQLRDSLNVSSEFFCRSIHRMECVGID